MSAHTREEAHFQCDTCGVEYADRGMIEYGTCNGCGKTWCAIEARRINGSAPGLFEKTEVFPCFDCEEIHHYGCMTEGDDEELRCSGCAAKEKS